MSAPNIRIMLVDDHHVARESWRMLLDSHERLTVVFDTDKGQEAIHMAPLLEPDIMLVDINMHPVNGFEVVQRVLELNPAQKIIGISVNNQPSYASHMLHLGAKGFITKGSPFDEIVTAIFKVFDGERYLCKEIRGLSA